MNFSKTLSVLIFSVLFSFNSYAQGFIDGNYKEEKSETKAVSFTQYKVEDIAEYTGKNTKAKNIILLIGDGMGSSHVFAAIAANNGKSYFQKFNNTGFSKTQSASSFVTDSGAGGTAIATGHSVKNGVISVDENNAPLKTILEIAEDNNKATGVVATSTVTHATPASFVAHNKNRKNYEEIASDFLTSGIDLFIGSGKSHFDDRKDKQNLIKELENKGYEIVLDKNNISKIKGDKVAGLLFDESIGRYKKRGEILVPATIKAIEVLNKNNNGFFLMIEGSQIDWASHENNVDDMITEVAEFDRAVGEALKFAEKDGNTLVIVTADHETGGFIINDGSIEKGTIKGSFNTTHHTGTMVPVFAYGPGAESFNGVYKNTKIFYKMLDAFEFDVNVAKKDNEEVIVKF
ncbi:MAG: alkaline phosphatase [Ichthyobacteriaceae bacterium]|nr:alkaline phosphatase [Ichthyobacteriaceae bacterium]